MSSLIVWYTAAAVLPQQPPFKQSAVESSRNDLSINQIQRMAHHNGSLIAALLLPL
jgi:hypothetical protein